jgi:hypothetical protein
MSPALPPLKMAQLACQQLITGAQLPEASVTQSFLQRAIKPFAADAWQRSSKFPFLPTYLHPLSSLPSQPLCAAPQIPGKKLCCRQACISCLI